MNSQSFATLDIVPIWGRLNETLIALLDYVPEERMNWSPSPELWSFRGILLHTIIARDSWMGGCVKDGVAPPNVLETAQSKEGMRTEFRRSWERVRSFLSDPANLEASYEWGPQRPDFRKNGHWIAFHLLEHDVHHRADIFHYLALLGIEHPEVETP